MIKAKIKWLLMEEGGREKQLPLNSRYTPQIRLISESQKYIKEAWSIMFNSTETDENNESIIEFDFLNKGSYPPERYEKLISGEEFNLYEGAKKVAIGKVI